MAKRAASRRAGLIPAHAGKTLGGIRFRWSAWAHPRACGENPPAFYCRYGHPGSSPRMRGKLDKVTALVTFRGLIPAHAGKTLFHRRCGRARGAHPRACGENLRVHRPPLLSRGSSPRMRGKHHRGITPSSGIRLIPAHAGKTASFALYATSPRAHPRACGENPTFFALKTSSFGSSPRMRGKLRVRPQPRVPRRLIPAHAGKTCRACFIGCHSAAHPRACGENPSRSRSIRA